MLGWVMTDAELIPYAYVLAVRDLTGISAYFREVLGFTLEWTDGDRWRALRRGKVRINPGRCPDALPPAELGDHNDFGLLITQDVDDLHREFATTGAIIRRSPPISHGDFGRWVWPPPKAIA